MDPAAEGTVYPDVSFAVDAERVDAFRRIFGQKEGVPPTFVTAAEFAVYPLVIEDPRLDLDFSRVVHGSQAYEYRRPLREGEVLTARTRIESAKVRSATGFLTIAVDLVDAQGDLVATARSQLIERAREA
jgi:acyl dehydratase